MKNYFSRILLITISFYCLSSDAFAQSWLELIENKKTSFYDVEKDFMHWHDSVSGAEVFFKAAENEKQQLRTLEKNYRKWAQQHISRMDASGFYMDDNALWKEYKKHRSFKLKQPASQSFSSWASPGPVHLPGGNGLVRCLAVDPNDTTVIYAGVPTGGLWKTTNGGINWVPLTDSVAALGISSIAIDPMNGNNVYILIASRMYKSIDAGSTWIELSFNSALVNSLKSEIIVNPQNSLEVYCSDGNVLHKSTDGGLSWNIIQNRGYIVDIALNPLNGQTVYVLYSQKFFKSSDGGATYDSTNLSTLPWWGGYAIGVTAADTNYIYLYSGVSNGIDGLVALSTNRGATFVLQPLSNQLTTFGNYLKHITVSPTDKNTLIFGGIGISKTTDGGLTWTQLNISGLSEVHVDQRQLALIGNTVYFANDGGVYKTDDFGLTFHNLTGDLQVTEIQDMSSLLTDTLNLRISAPHNSLMQLTDSVWTSVGAGDGVSVSNHPANPEEFFYKNQYGYTHYIQNGDSSIAMGSGINESTYSFTPNYPLAFNIQNPSSNYILIKNVWKSIDNGATYVKISDFLTLSEQGGGSLLVHPADSGYIYTTKQKTNDGGLNWTPMTQVHDFINKITADPSDPMRLWVANGAYTYPVVSYSSDGGNTWTDLPSQDLPSENSQDIKYIDNGHDGILLMLRNSLHYIDNRLSNWQTFDDGLPYSIFSTINLVPAFNKIRVGTMGRGIWERGYYDDTQPLVADFISDKDIICPGETVQFYDNSINNGPGFSPVYNWQFPGGNAAVSSLPDPAVQYNASGTYAVTLTVSNSINADSITKSTFITVQLPLVSSAPFSEGFEGNFPPAGWKIIKENLQFGWKKIGYGGYDISTSSALISNVNATTVPVKELLLSPEIDFSGIQNPVLFFDRAYYYDTIPNQQDTLKIFYTTDCNVTRNYIYEKGGNDLATIFTGVGSAPDSSQWETDTILLSGVPNSAKFGFESHNHNGGNLYIDNININGTTGIKDAFTGNKLEIYPVPADDNIFIFWSNQKTLKCKVQLYNSYGSLLRSQSIYSNTIGSIDVSGLAAGVYVLQLWHEDEFLVRKIVIT